MPARTRTVAVTAAAGLLAAGGAWAVTASTSPAATSHSARPAATDRFLQLTGASAARTSGGGHGNSGQAPGHIKKASARTCPSDAGTVGMMPNGWCIRPAGTNVDVLRFPLGVLPVNNGSQVVVTSGGGGPQGLTVVDTATLQATPTTQGNLFMGLAPTPDGRLLASGGNADRVFRFHFAGPALVSDDATEQATFPLHGGIDGAQKQAGLGSASLPAGDGVRVPGYPGPMATYDADGHHYVLVAGTLSEPAAAAGCPGGQSACARVSVLDADTDTVVARVPVGLDAIGLAVDTDRRRLYVANWGDEVGRGGASGGTVSVVDLTGEPAGWHETSFTGVGHHPEAVQLSADGTRLFVTNTNDDTLSVLDVSGAAAPTVLATEPLSPMTGAPVGAHPDALALSPDGDTLFVALAGLNAVEVRYGHTGQRLAGQPVYIPTGWYPSALTITGDAEHYKLWVTNAKGTGPGPGYNGSVLFNGTKLDGSVTAVDLPVSAEQQNTWTAQTRDNDDLNSAGVDACSTSTPGVTVSQVLCPPAGQSSPIKHVLYIVTENKTFDQYFGDMGGDYRADPTYTLYGQQNTPNHHSIADRYSLGDNFFSDAEVSVTGHSWTSGAVATDHNEKTWEADYDQGLRGTHGNSDPLRGSVGSGEAGGEISAAEDELNDPEGGYLFEAFKRAGAVPPSEADNGTLSMAIYGEHVARESGHALDSYLAKGWKDGDIEYADTCRAKEFITGKAPETLVPGSDQMHAGSPPAGASFYGCQGRTLAPEFSLAKWEADYQASGRDTMPSFLYMSLPDNHTLATTVGSPTPQSMVADNDYAIGLITDALSHSPFWKNTVIVQTEDDTQAAGDHVSTLRDYMLLASPWAKPGANHQWGSMPALLRTIEQVFGVAPISLFDQLATPMHDAFLPSLSDTPDLKPYDAVKPAVPFALNQSDAPGAALSKRMDCWATYDLCDEQTLNAILYADIKGWPLKISHGDSR
jgi:DNA-binding beta-propeller fold protein YncE